MQPAKFREPARSDQAMDRAGDFAVAALAMIASKMLNIHFARGPVYKALQPIGLLKLTISRRRRPKPHCFDQTRR